MEAKIMKMKKLLAVVLTGVMAVSMLTGCASVKTRDIAKDLEGMLKGVNGKANVTATNDADKLSDKAAKKLNGKTVLNEQQIKTNVDTALESELKKTDMYVWYTTFETKGLSNTEQARQIKAKLIANDAINTDGAANKNAVANIKKDNKTYKPTAGNNFELGISSFSMGEGAAKKDYVVVVVTCKAVASTEEA